jgi:peptide methionine sulfoxide reductase msrA/msrB
MKRKELSNFEKFVIFEKGTEKPFSGKYNDHFEEGMYICKNCGIPLYTSNDKFHSHCGWPSFDDEIPNAVEKRPDPDGTRTEISCSYCGAHLGHVFKGEKYTEKNIRHCVNSVSLDFLKKDDIPTLNRIYFAAGCFWGVEHLIKELDGVERTRVGYMGGHMKLPSYKQVCMGITGHAETVEVIYNQNITTEKLIKYFFEIHDFTQIDRQGPDIGNQYRSVIFHTTEQQKDIAEKLKKNLEKNYEVATKIEKAKTFWLAEDYHQRYYEKTKHSPYCHYEREIDWQYNTL